MKTLANDRDREGILSRLALLRPENTRVCGRMSAHQAVCHLSDSFRVPLGMRHTEPIRQLWGYLHADHHLRQFGV